MSETNETNETKETFGPFTLNTLCNTVIISKIPDEYSDFALDVARKCNPNETKICLICRPLADVLADVDIVLDKERTDYIPELLGVGRFNDVYTLPKVEDKKGIVDGKEITIVNENKNAVIRLFQPEVGTYGGILDNMQNEIFGAFIQTYLSKPKDEGGLGCPYINKVYDFGEYKSDNPNTDFRRIIKNVKPRFSDPLNDDKPRFSDPLNDDKSTIKSGYISTIKSGDIAKPYMILESLKMNLVDKIKLFDEIKEEIDNVTILKYFQQILLGLKCMHDNNLFHLDIKPANIMVDNEDNIKLVDFGFTVPKDFGFTVPKDFGFTVPKDFVGGTPKYWSFTYANDEYRKRNRMPIDDLWSVGLTILDLLKIKSKKVDLNGYNEYFYSVRRRILREKLSDSNVEVSDSNKALKKIIYALFNIFFVPTKGTFSTMVGRFTRRNNPILTKGITEDTDLNKIKPRYESSNNHILTCEWLLDNFLGYPIGYIKDENIGGKRRKTRKRRYKKKSMKGKKKH